MIRKYFFILALVLIYSNLYSQSGYTGTCYFPNAAAMHAFTPVKADGECTKAILESTYYEYIWNGTSWVLPPYLDLYDVSSNLTTSYIPYWTGTEFADSPLRRFNANIVELEGVNPMLMLDNTSGGKQWRLQNVANSLYFNQVGTNGQLIITSATNDLQHQLVTGATASYNVRSDGNSFFRVTRNGGALTQMVSTATHGVMGTLTAHDLQLFTGNSVKMTIKNAGKIGIGTTVPLAYLHLPANRDAIFDDYIWLNTAKSYGIVHNNASAINTIIGGTAMVSTQSIAGTGVGVRAQSYSTGGIADNYPTWSFLNDTDTGVYRNEEDQVGFTAGASRRFMVSGGTTPYVNFYDYGTTRPSDGVPNSILWTATSSGSLRRSLLADIPLSAMNNDLPVVWTGSNLTGNTYRTGNVGIGATDPQDLLQLQSAVDGVDVSLRIRSQNAKSGIKLYNISNERSHLYHDGVSNLTIWDNDTNFEFWKSGIREVQITHNLITIEDDIYVKGRTRDSDGDIGDEGQEIVATSSGGSNWQDKKRIFKSEQVTAHDQEVGFSGTQMGGWIDIDESMDGGLLNYVQANTITPIVLASGCTITYSLEVWEAASDSYSSHSLGVPTTGVNRFDDATYHIIADGTTSFTVNKGDRIHLIPITAGSCGSPNRMKGLSLTVGVTDQ